MLIKTRKSIAWDNRYAIPLSFCHEISQMMLHMIACILSFDWFSPCSVHKVWWNHVLGWYDFCRHKQEIYAVLPVFGALIHGLSKQFLGFLSRTKSSTCPSLEFFTPVGVLHFLLALCMTLWLSLLLLRNGLSHLCHTIYQSCHIGIEVFNAMDQHIRVSDIMDCSWGSGL